MLITTLSVVSAGLPWSPLGLQLSLIVSVGLRPVVLPGLQGSRLVSRGLAWSPRVLPGVQGSVLVSSSLAWYPGVSAGFQLSAWSPGVSAGL